MPPNFSGDSLTYAIGPQWTGRLSSRWVTHTRVLVGGNKVTQEQLFPDIKAELQQEYKNQHNIFPPLADQYIHDFDNNAFAVSHRGRFRLQVEQGLAVSLVIGLLAYVESRHQRRELSQFAAILFRVRAEYGDVVR